jgi:hypothetical protein
MNVFRKNKQKAIFFSGNEEENWFCNESYGSGKDLSGKTAALQ